MDGEITFRSDEMLTPEEFLAWLEERPTGDVNRYELIQGRIVMTPPAGFATETGFGSPTSSASMKRITCVVLDSKRGLSSSFGRRLEPDVSFAPKQRLVAAGAQDEDSFARVVPDLVIEVLSPPPLVETERRRKTST
jgi:Uma2 family endonuclease